MDDRAAPLTARSRTSAGPAAGLLLAMLLSGCVQPPAGATTGAAGGTAGAATGGAAAGGTGLVWPFAGWRNPFDPAAAVEPDLRGRIGGQLDTSGAAGAGAGSAAAGAVRDPFAGQGVQQPAVAAPAGSTSAGAAGTAAATHTVVAGETAWSISRRYGVGVAELAAANGLPESMAIRTGQRLTIPAAAAQATPSSRVVVTAPGVGSPTPQPPSASQPLPAEQTIPAATPVARPETPDLGATRTAASGSGRFTMPVQGSIIRAYEKGRNEGIDISAAPGTAVKAAGAGAVAAITRDTDGGPIVVIRHDGTLMTVYAGLDELTVAKGDTVAAGQTIGKATAAGVIHFEVRRGFESVDPVDFLD